MEVRDKLNRHVQKYKESSKLNSRETGEAAKLLEELFCQDYPGLAEAFYFWASLPSNAAVQGLSGFWEKAENEERKVLSAKLIGYDNGSKQALLNRKIPLISGVIKFDSIRAADLLRHVCTEITNSGRDMPGKVYLSRTQELFANSHKDIFSEVKMFGRDLEPLFVVTVCSLNMTDEQDIISGINEIRIQSLEWLSEAQIKVNLNKKLGRELGKILSRWPEECRPLLQQLGFAAAWLSREENITQSIPLQTCFDAISQLVSEKDSMIEKYRATIIKLESDLERHKERIKRIEASLQLSAESLDAERAESETLRRKINLLQENLETLETLISGEREEHKKKTAALAELVTAEARHQVSAFQNKLAGTLKTEYADYMSIRNEPVSPELGENLKRQIDTIFSVLAKEGIKCQ